MLCRCTTPAVLVNALQDIVRSRLGCMMIMISQDKPRLLSFVHSRLLSMILCFFITLCYDFITSLVTCMACYWLWTTIIMNACHGDSSLGYS